MSISRMGPLMVLALTLAATAAWAQGAGDFDRFINFDDVTAPALVMDTVALTTEYVDQGVIFSGPWAGSGGAVLLPTGVYVTGYSAPNILLFNCLAYYSDGHGAEGPERIDFVEPATRVSVRVGSDVETGYGFELNAYDSGGNLIATDSVVMSATFQQLTVSAPNIAYVVLGSRYCMWGMDDLGFDVGVVADESESWGHLKSLYR